MEPRCSSAETQVCHRSYIIAAKYNGACILSQLSNLFHCNILCKNILKITIIWHNELFNGKGLKANHMIFVGLFQLRFPPPIKLTPTEMC
jgi:hypothetical protein